MSARTRILTQVIWLQRFNHSRLLWSFPRDDDNDDDGEGDDDGDDGSRS